MSKLFILVMTLAVAGFGDWAFGNTAGGILGAITLGGLCLYYIWPTTVTKRQRKLAARAAARRAPDTNITVNVSKDAADDN